MLAALASSDATLQRAAVEGLADLRDPATSALLTSFLRRGPDSPNYSAARRGLLALGREAWPELRQLAIAEALEARREAGLLLAEQGAAEAVPILIRVLRDAPDDARVAQELAVLTCVDFRDDLEPVRAWTDWWANAVQDDSLAWFRGAQERAGLQAAPVGSLAGEGTRRGAESLLETLAVTGQPLLVERAERELERLLGRAVERPADPSLELEWRTLLREEVAARFP
jgi:HEAT repeat protein